MGRDGQVRGDGTLLSALFGPEKPEQRTPLTLALDLPKPTRLVLRILTVSHRANLRVQLDGRTVAEFPSMVLF